MSLLVIIREQHLLILFALHLITSLVLIYYGKNKLSYLAEILLLACAIYYHMPPLEYLPIYFAEYLVVKLLLVLIIWIAKHFSFYVLVVITHKQKYKRMHKFLIKKKRFLRMQSHIWHKVHYGIRIKKGIPSMVNKRNTQTGISFDKNGFPKFKVIAEIKIPRKYWKKDRSAHFYQASKLLYKKMQKNAWLKKKFSMRAINEFKKGNIPTKYTWHHHQDKGVLQLVESEIHSKVRHNGGYSIWGKKE